MKPLDPNAILASVLGGLFLITLFFLGKAYDRRRARAENDATTEGLYIGGVQGLLVQMKEQVKDAQQAAHEAQSEVTKAQAAAGTALETASREQGLRVELRQQFDEALRQIATLQEQVQTLQNQVLQLQQENAGLIGGAIGLSPASRPAKQLKGTAEKE